MGRYFTLEYWEDEGWCVGKLKEVPGVFSQGQTLEELKENILEAYNLMQEEEEGSIPDIIKRKIKEIQKAPVPRHKEIRNTLCMLIRKQLGI